jgi:HD-GYP domain-containing protein (c-di-GMP phosphodiesterase class II)
MATRQIPVGELKYGMYIAQLDRPWTETPFMFQGFYLRNGKQLEALRKFCRSVFVDVERTERDALERTGTFTPLAPAGAPGFAVRGITPYPDRTEVLDEMARAGAAFERAARAVQELFRLLERGTPPLDATEVQAATLQLAESVIRNPDALLLMSKMREASAAAHARALQVSILVMVLARYLQLDPDEMKLLGLLGLLQDIGKTRLPAAVLHKKGPLTPEETEIAKKHVELSGHILGATRGLPSRLAPLTLLHHERQDGSGYPRGLKAYQIGLYGSIAAICDTYDALTAFRPYAEQLAPSAAVAQLLGERGTGFHAGLVEQFIQCLGAFPIGAVIELNSGETGIVVAQSPTQRLKPTIIALREPSGARMRPKVLHLDQDPGTPSRGEPYRIRRTLEQSRLVFDPRELLGAA